MKIDKIKIVCVLSLLLNLLGGTGVISPPIGGTVCPPPAAVSH